MTIGRPDRSALFHRRTGAAAVGGLGALAVLSAAHIIIDAYSSSYAPLLALLRERHGLTLEQVGWGAAVFTFSASITQPLYGLLSDRLRSPVVIILAPAFSALGIAALPFVGAYGTSLACLFLAGVGVAAFHPQGATQAADTLVRKPGTAMALFVGAGNLGFALGPIAVSTAFAIWGWDGLWRLAIPGLIASLLLVRSAPRPAVRSTPAAGDVGRALAARWRPLLCMYLFVVVRGTVQLVYVGFLPLLLIDRGMSIGTASLALSAFLAAGSIGSLAGGVLGDRVGERAVLRFSMSASLPLFLVAFAMPSTAALVAALCAGFFVLLQTNALTIVLAQSWVPEHRSTVSSLLMGFAWGVGGIVAPVVGRIADAYGLERALFGVGLLPALGLALAWRLPRRGA